MRNSYKFTKLYSGGEPTFTEDGDLFRIVIPLSKAATVSAGPKVEPSMKDEKNQMIIRGEMIKLSGERVNDLINYCVEPKSVKEIMEYLNIKSRDYFRNKILLPMIDTGLIEMTIPDKPKSPKQKYRSKELDHLA